MTSKATSWLRPNDFSESKILLRMLNSTTQIPLAEGSVELTSIHGSQLTFTVPIQSCAFGHFMMVEAVSIQASPFKAQQKLTEATAPKKLTFTGKVIEEQKLDDQKKAITVSLFQFDQAQLNQFIDQINEQQQRVNKVVGNISGSDHG